MKLLTYLENGEELLGVLSQDEFTIIPLRDNGFGFKDMLTLIERITLKEKQELRNLSQKHGVAGLFYDVTKVLSPIPRPREDIICLGLNYKAHLEESSRYKGVDFTVKDNYPVYFGKRATYTSGQGDKIPSYSGMIKTLDYECELAVIIGRECKNIAPDKVQDYIFGYTILNDVTARELQSRHTQWYYGKGMDGFTPMGPVIRVPQEGSGIPVFSVKSFVNGEPRQDSSTDKFIFDIPYIVSELSQGITLRPGTIISTGTPSGVGMGFDPPKFLNSGDEVVCEIGGIGKLKNTVE